MKPIDMVFGKRICILQIMVREFMISRRSTVISGGRGGLVKNSGDSKQPPSKTTGITTTLKTV